MYINVQHVHYKYMRYMYTHNYYFIIIGHARTKQQCQLLL